MLPWIPVLIQCMLVRDCATTERDFGGYLSVCGGFYAALPHFVCEIPAYAGMVHGEWRFVGNFGGDVWRQLACRLLRIHSGVAAFVCEIPAFAGMVCGGMEGSGYILVLFRATIWRGWRFGIFADGGDSDGGDNAVFADGFPFPRGPFLRRQESHSVVSPHATGKGVRPWRFLPTQEWSAGERECVWILPLFAYITL